MSVHHTDPFADPPERRSPVRRLRGRLPSPVTLWTAPGPAGLTVSSTLIADGEPPIVLGLLDEESDLYAAAVEHGVFAVTLLGPHDRQLADRFAGLMPSAGGLFATGDWRPTPYGPVPGGDRARAGCRLRGDRPVGWGRLVEATIETAEPADGEPLIHYRGRYRTL